MRTRTFLSLVVLGVALLLGTEAQTTGSSCECENGGEVRASTDLPQRCECSCPTGYYPPTCAFTATQEVIVYSLWENTTAVKYVSGSVKVRKLYDIHNYNAQTQSDAIKVQRRASELEPRANYIVLLLRVQGQYADVVVRDFLVAGASAGKYSSIALIDMYFYEPAPSDPSNLGSSSRIGTVPWQAIEWIIGTLIMLILFPILECILGSVCAGSTFCTSDAMAAEKSVRN